VYLTGFLCNKSLKKKNSKELYRTIHIEDDIYSNSENQTCRKIY